MAGRAAGRRAGRPAGRDHRADRPEDDDQRAQLGRQGLAGRLRGRQHSPVGEHDRGPAQPQGRPRPDHRLHLGRGQELRPQPGRHPGHDRGQAARLAPGREAHPDRRQARLRQPDRLRALHGGVRPAPARHRQGPLLLPGQDGVPPRGADVERRVQHRPGLPRDPARHDQGHGADRDDPGRLRDGRDPVRAARAQRRAQRRALGLPVLGDQEVPHPGPRVHAAGAERGDDDRPGHARLHRPARADLPQARRVRDGRDGGVHPVPARRGGQRGRAGEGPRGQDPRGRATGSTAPGSPTRTWCRSAARCSTGCSAPGPTSFPGSARRSR